MAGCIWLQAVAAMEGVSTAYGEYNE